MARFKKQFIKITRGKFRWLFLLNIAAWTVKYYFCI